MFTGGARFLLNPFGKISRIQFLAAGAMLTATKLALDYFVTTALFHQSWRPVEYIWSKSPLLVWSEHRALPFYFTMLLIATPFAWMGVCLCAKRLRDAGSPIWTVLFFFVPLAKWFFFAILAATPSQATEVPPLPAPLRGSFRQWIGATAIRSALFAVTATAVLGIFFVYVSVHLLRQYGSTLFVGVPFYLGIMAALIHGSTKPRTLAELIIASLLSLVIVGAFLLIFATEGIVCLVLAAPIAVTESILGALIGYAFASARWRTSVTIGAPTALLLPFLFATEPHDALPIYKTTTQVVINMDVEAVWRQVIAFSEIPPPRELIFRAGVAYPVRARLDGNGVGAIRHCVFSTGEFVEPITMWNEPIQLSFDVLAQPDPMTELSPYGKIDTPHLHGYFNSKGGEFRLTALPGGRTLLIGTTWYENHFRPEMYWVWWEDYLLHSIHRRVLGHIKVEAQRCSDRSG